MDDIACKKPMQCQPVTDDCCTPPSPAFDLCVGNYTLSWDGKHAYIEKVRHIEDGTYDTVNVVGGCIVGFGSAPPPQYTPPYCAPDPTPCQDVSGSGTGTSSISPAADNSLTATAGGWFARTYINVGNGVSISGVGTVANPYVITAAVGTGGTSGAYVFTDGLTAYKPDPNVNTTWVGLVNRQAVAGTYGIEKELRFDQYGVLVEVSDRLEPLIDAGEGLTTRVEGDTMIIAHETYPHTSPVQFGGYEVTVDGSGHLTSITQNVAITAGIYTFGKWLVNIDSVGNIREIIANPDGGGSTTPATGSLRALYKYTEATTTGGVTGRYLEVFGEPVTYSASANTLRITLPAWVTSASQILINNSSVLGIVAVNFTYDPTDNSITVNEPAASLTIAVYG